MALESEINPPTEHQGIALTLARTIDSYGLNSRQIFLAAGIKSSHLNSPEYRVLGENLQRVWETAIEATGDDALGIAFAKHFRVGALHGLGIACATSNTLYDALQRLVRYFRIICTAGVVVLEEDGDNIKLWLKLPVPAGIAVDASLDAGLALFIQLCRYAKNSKFCAQKVLLQRAQPLNVQEFHDFFNCPIHFDSAENILILKKSDLETPLPISNPSLARANDRVVIDYLKQFDKKDIVSQVRAAIIETLPSGIPTQEKIAISLGKSSRSLQRKLAEKNTTFSKLVEQIRSDLSKQYLSEPNRTISEIAYMLGYTEPSNFSRSFKQWTELTPKEYRSQQQEQ